MFTRGLMFILEIFFALEQSGHVTAFQFTSLITDAVASKWVRLIVTISPKFEVHKQWLKFLESFLLLRLKQLKIHSFSCPLFFLGVSGEQPKEQSKYLKVNSHLRWFCCLHTKTGVGEVTTSPTRVCCGEKL